MNETAKAKELLKRLNEAIDNGEQDLKAWPRSLDSHGYLVRRLTALKDLRTPLQRAISELQDVCDDANYVIQNFEG